MMAVMEPQPGEPGSPSGEYIPRRATLADLYEAHYAELVRLATLLVHDQATAEELTQDAFVKWATDAPRLDEPAKAGAYLRSMVLNAARSEIRRRGLRNRLRLLPDRSAEPSPGGPEHHAVADDDARAVLAALATLSERQREVLVLRYWLDLSEKEIAEALGMAPGTVKSHAHRALAALEDLLEKQR